jgi:hypothetical protein
MRVMVDLAALLNEEKKTPLATGSVPSGAMLA